MMPRRSSTEMDSKGHQYTVELRVYGLTLDPDTITKETGLKPCQTRLAGARLGSKTFSESMWAFDGGLEDRWHSLEDGLTAVLDRVEQRREALQRFGREHSLIWWCGHFQSSFDGGPRLSPALLKRLAEFGAELFIDNYFSDKDRN